MPMLGVLQPLTSISASLSIVKSSMQVSLHKQLAFDNQTKVTKKEAIVNFTETFCRSIISGSGLNIINKGR